MFSGFDFINHLGGNTGREVRTSGEPHSDQRVTSPGVFLNISAFRKNVIVANRTNAADGKSSHEKIAIAAELTALSFEPVAAKRREFPPGRDITITISTRFTCELAIA